MSKVVTYAIPTLHLKWFCLQFNSSLNDQVRHSLGCYFVTILTHLEKRGLPVNILLLLQPNAYKKNDPPSYVHLDFHNTVLLLVGHMQYIHRSSPIAAQYKGEHTQKGRSSYARLVVVVETKYYIQQYGIWHYVYCVYCVLKPD